MAFCCGGIDGGPVCWLDGGRIGGDTGVPAVDGLDGGLIG
jgi:hypothetical protein